MIARIGPVEIKDLHRDLITFGVVRFMEGETNLFASGIKSPGVYVQMRNLSSFPSVWEIFRRYARTFLETRLEINGIASVATGGITHGAALAAELSLPHVVARKVSKKHGDHIGNNDDWIIEGSDLVLERNRFLVVEDTGSTGASSIGAVNALRLRGAEVNEILYLAAYGFSEHTDIALAHGVELNAIVFVDEIVETALEMGVISEEYRNFIRLWHQNPRSTWEWPV